MDAPAVLYLHGGPGYNSYGFERFAAERVAPDVRVVMLDQRGCGRSPLGPGAAAGMDATVEDLEALRRALDIQRWAVLGHSFGGLVAQVYAARHPEAVNGILLAESTSDLRDALEYQVRTALELAPALWPEKAEALSAVPPGAPIERLLTIYGIVGQSALQRELHWVEHDAQRDAERLDATSGLLQCSSPEVFSTYRAEGWFDDTTLPKMTRPAVVVGGRGSAVIGVENLEATAKRLGAPLVWIEDSGHFPFMETPERFSTWVVRWTKAFSAAGSSVKPSATESRRLD